MRHTLRILTRGLRERQERNPSFSLRAFAKQLGVSPQHLSLVMNGKRDPTLDFVARITGQLKVSEIDAQLMRAECVEAGVSRGILSASTPAQVEDFVLSPGVEERKCLENAMVTLEEFKAAHEREKVSPTVRRDSVWAILPLDPDDFELIRGEVDQFIGSLSSYLEKGEVSESSRKLMIGFYPMTEAESDGDS